MSKWITNEIKKEMVLKYEEGFTGGQLAEYFGYYLGTIYKTLKKCGVKRRHCHRIYSLDESFFENIDNEEKAYWLGFITADGSIRKVREYGRLHLALKVGDKLHLSKFLNALKSNHPIKTYTIKARQIKNRFIPQSELASVAINSQKIFDDLLKLNVFPNKSSCEIPWNGEPSLMRHYFRGLIDGDGTVGKYCYSNLSPRWKIGLCGSRAILESFSNWVINYANINSSPKIFQQGKIHVIKYEGTKISRQLANVLYSDCTIFLDRKRKILEEILEE